RNSIRAPPWPNLQKFALLPHNAPRPNSCEFGYNWDMPYSLQARVVYPVDRPPVEHGVVTIDGERIVAVGTKAVGGEVIDLGNVALLPGLVNAHTHLEFSYLLQPLGQPGMRLVDWIRLVIAERGRTKRKPMEDMKRGLHQALEAGVTTVGDITTNIQTLGGDVTHFHEVIAFSRARAGSAMTGLVERIESQRANSNDSLHGVSPHAPYTVSPNLIELLVSYARQRNVSVAMHLAESRGELELLRDGTGPFRDLLEERSMWDAEAIPHGSRPLDYLRLLAQAPRALVIHGNYLVNDELAFIGAHRDRMSLIYCPRTHAYFAHPPYPLNDALAAGVRIALGTDSRASNPDLSVLAEMRHATRMHPHVVPEQILRMGTLDGAAALGRESDVGSITAGKRANLVAVPIRDDEHARPTQILEAILADDAAPWSVYLSGRRL
ncbi:MAG TPA: amidohydrolase family protein, partial [Lacipirellulaceae bacterium]|nr:amidohydrolase family protein [Lacipirellulaceae bacterium]